MTFIRIKCHTFEWIQTRDHSCRSVVSQRSTYWGWAQSHSFQGEFITIVLNKITFLDNKPGINN